MKVKLFFLALIFICGSATAQKIKYSKKEKKMLKEYYFNEGFSKPATKKVSTITLKNGKVRKGYVTGVRSKKMQIKTIMFRDSLSGNEKGEKERIESQDIAEALMYASGLEKFSKVSDQIQKMGMGQRNNMRKATTGDQIYFVNQSVSLKNKKDETEFLMQLLNPDFDDIISVYYDPMSNESGSFGVGGASFGGGVLKSYYVKKGDRIFWLRKKDLKKEYDFLFGDNSEFMKKYPLKSIKWDWISALILQYTLMSQSS